MFNLTLVQLIKIHKKINKVLKRRKKSEIPSTPKLKFIFKIGIHKIFVTNWNEPIDLLKKTHKNNEIKYKIPETFNAIDFKSEWFDAGTSIKQRILIIGNKMRIANKFFILKKKKSNINIL